MEKFFCLRDSILHDKNTIIAVLGYWLTTCNTAPPTKSKMAARGPQNVIRGLERVIPLCLLGYTDLNIACLCHFLQHINLYKKCTFDLLWRIWFVIFKKFPRVFHVRIFYVCGIFTLSVNNIYKLFLLHHSEKKKHNIVKESTLIK